jgi:hypothetical protein
MLISETKGDRIISCQRDTEKRQEITKGDLKIGIAKDRKT